MYEWHLLTSPETEVKTNLGVSGRANAKERPYVYLYGEEAVNSASDLHDMCIVNFDYLHRFLHRLISRAGISQKFMISWRISR